MTRIKTSAVGFTVETHEAVTTTATIDTEEAQYHYVELEDDANVEIIVADTEFDGLGVTLLFEDALDGPHEITWPSEVIWQEADTRSTVEAGSTLEVSLSTYDGGETWIAGETGRNFE